MLTGYQAYKLYVALKAHFKTKTYNFVKNKGHTRASVKAYERRNDKIFFQKLADINHGDVKGFLIAGFVHDPNMWIGEFTINDETNKIYWEWVGRRTTLNYHFGQTLRKLGTKENLTQALLVKDGQLPKLIVDYLEGTLSPEVLLILIDLTRSFSYLDKNLSKNILWPEIRLRLVKYKYLFEYDKDNMKKIMENHWKWNTLINSHLEKTNVLPG